MWGGKGLKGHQDCFSGIMRLKILIYPPAFLCTNKILLILKLFCRLLVGSWHLMCCWVSSLSPLFDLLFFSVISIYTCWFLLLPVGPPIPCLPGCVQMQSDVWIFICSMDSWFSIWVSGILLAENPGKFQNKASTPGSDSYNTILTQAGCV